jgi:hypothetical protein
MKWTLRGSSLGAKPISANSSDTSFESTKQLPEFSLLRLEDQTRFTDRSLPARQIRKRNKSRLKRISLFPEMALVRCRRSRCRTLGDGFFRIIAASAHLITKVLTESDPYTDNIFALKSCVRIDRSSVDKAATLRFVKAIFAARTMAFVTATGIPFLFPIVRDEPFE